MGQALSGSPRALWAEQGIGVYVPARGFVAPVINRHLLRVGCRNVVGEVEVSEGGGQNSRKREDVVLHVVTKSQRVSIYRLISMYKGSDSKVTKSQSASTKDQ